ncbi:unnamed protein product [Citrullus colocynthis]|uniref:Uncharacterized protein n=1 Tax=Citrullus colocynthis TaxID=252529 RepID=A0ABP0YEL2_9ROSI
MPFYDYIYDNSTDDLQIKSLKQEEDVADVVHLTHLTTPDSIYHLCLGFVELASRPHTSTWYLRLLSPITMLLTWIYGLTFVLQINQFQKLKLQTWAIPKFKFQLRPNIWALVHSCPFPYILGWTDYECRYAMSDIERVWKATLERRFQPLDTPMVPMAPRSL